jgi:signal peptidase
MVVLAAAAVTVGPRLLPYKTFGVASASMEPTLPVGSLIVTVPVAADRLRVGDIITFHRPGDHSLVTHRIARIENGPQGRVFVTKGDANGAEDGWVVPAVGTGLRLAFEIPGAGLLASHPVGRFGLLLASTLILCGLAIERIWRSAPTRSRHVHGVLAS